MKRQSDSEREPPLVLVVDDDPMERLLERSALEQAGFAVEEAENGAMALSAFECQQPDAVLLDVMMPELDGFTVCSEIRKRAGGELTPVFVITGLDDLESLSRAYAVGATDFIAKPINWGVLGYHVRYMLRASRAFSKLRLSEAKNKALLNAIPDLMFIISEDGIFLEAKGSKEVPYIAPPHEFLGKRLDEVLPKDVAQKAIYHLKQSFETRDTQSFVYELKIDGARHYHEARIVPCGNKDALTIVRDITEQKRSEEALRESEARYHAVIDQSADSICLVDVQARGILEANTAFQKMLSYSSEEIRGLSIYAFEAAATEDIDRRFQEILTGGAPLFHERQYRRKDDSLVDVWASGSLISYAGKKAVCIIARDLTEKKALEAQLLRSQRVESIGLLAGGIAHDLNNILAPILLNAELLSRSVSEPAGQKMLSSVASNAQRGADIVKQILAFAHGAESERLLMTPRHLLKETERFMRETFPKSIQFETEIPPDLWPLSGNPTQLHQVLMNLSINAKDAMPRGGTLALSAENLSVDEAYARMHPKAKVGPYIVLTVSDTGMGIPPENLDRIFEPFFSTKEKGRGTGLGLSVIHGIVEGHGGFVNVYSEVGKGTKFDVYLPASPSAEIEKAEEDKLPLHSGKGELILVVEDEPPIREITQAVLETHGYQVLAAADGAEAILLYAQHWEKIQAVMTDMAMPIMNGPNTIRALQRINPQVKVIVTSGLNDRRVLAEAGGLGVKAFLQKPFTAESLLKALSEVLGTTEG